MRLLTEIPTPLKAMRLKCLDCCCSSSEEVKQCAIPECSLYPYRLGKHPNIKKSPLTEEQKKALRARFQKSTETKRSPAVNQEI